MKKLDNEMQKTDKLLYSMIPRTVADRLRSGDLAVNTCEVIDQNCLHFVLSCLIALPIFVVALLVVLTKLS